ncbi:MAG TPA: copper homeostasis membrane protein CopD [Bradyrhizobium sp.]|jgi:putative copper resistance protein D|nr:copper homeostasis membrane protein CopD [Bradyrhizobium sp.]
MNWFGAGIDGPIIVTRAIHLAATAIVAGALTFRGVVAPPALRAVPSACALIDRQVRGIVWINLFIAVVSGLAWVLLLTMSLSGENLGEAVMSGALRDVLGLTQFGWVSQIRLAFAIALAICLVFDRSVLWRWLALGMAFCLTASIAWTGHAASTAHALGYLHLASDVLHLAAAAGWIGGLVPLALLLGAIRRHRGFASLGLDAVRRFSMLGIACVATLILSGAINSWILVGSFRGLVATGYGQLLMLKLAGFAAMLAFAALNRFSLTPRLTLAPDGAGRDARRKLWRNTVIEIVLGLSIFAMVGVLGTLHPAAHLVE